jgi:hypothetical protein
MHERKMSNESLSKNEKRKTSTENIRSFFEIGLLIVVLAT